MSADCLPSGSRQPYRLPRLVAEPILQLGDKGRAAFRAFVDEGKFEVFQTDYLLYLHDRNGNPPRGWFWGFPHGVNLPTHWRCAFAPENPSNHPEVSEWLRFVAWIAPWLPGPGHELRAFVSHASDLMRPLRLPGAPERPLTKLERADCVELLHRLDFFMGDYLASATNSPVEAAKPEDGEAEGILAFALSVAEIAERIGRNEKSVGSFLGRLAKKQPDCRIEIPNRRVREPEYLYRTADVWPAIEKWLKDG